MAQADMVELELRRSEDDRGLYALEGVGTLRLDGAFRSGATAESGGRSWRFARAGFWRRLQATDGTGTLVGAFERRLVRADSVVWEGREHGLGRASVWRERYALLDGDREIAILDGKAWGKRPVSIRVGDVAAIDPGLLLFAAFLVHTLARESSDGGASASSVAATG
jgi:hypothetical protein